MRFLAPPVLTLFLAVAATPAGAGRVLNGFELEPASVDVDEILRGGPPRDGIPALDHPKHIPAAQADWPDDDAMVLGVSWNGEARAYPIAILNWHELVNDTLGGRPILVSFCPLCGTGIVFDRRVKGEERTFGVSGLLYRSDLLMYDRGTESLWSQISAEAVTGPLLGERLELVRSSMKRFGEWKKQHPKTRVLTRETGYARDYDRTPYAGYAQSSRVMFPVPEDRRYHPKMPTLGVRTSEGRARAYPAAEVVESGGRVTDEFQGHPVRVAYDTEEQVFDVEAPPELEVIEGYWFAWAAFHPDTSVFVSEPKGESRENRNDRR